MDVVTQAIELIGKGVVGVGLIMAAAGAIQWGQANASNDGAAKSTALALIGGAAVVALVGFFIFPMIGEYFAGLSA